MELNKRLQRVESLIGQDSRIAGAKEIISFAREVGLIDEKTDTTQLFTDCVNQGLSMHTLLQKIDGKTLGLPSMREMV